MRRKLIWLSWGRSGVDWPGHPDLYTETNARRVMDQHVMTHMSGLESFALYDSGGTWARPEKLISWGTNDLYVVLNITKVSNARDADGTGCFLEAHDATVTGPEITFGKRYFDEEEPADLRTWEFWVPVDDVGMDGLASPRAGGGSARWRRSRRSPA